MYTARASKIYESVDLDSAPKTQIVERLFDRFARDIAAARVAVAVRDIPTKAKTIDHATQIAVQLRAALDRSAGPELCAQLDALYGFVIDRLAQGNLALTTQPLDEAAQIMATLGDGFRRAYASVR
ncbi:MAG TPA: flagellar export chaperone FliS [Kofleriaceae bacterium]|jgi:flagellar protein FliS